MSTRATIHFADEYGDSAIVYRHSDGYPTGLGDDLGRFLLDVNALSDTRFGDPSYLAAKWVVWDAAQHGQGMDFLGVGIVLEDPGDIEYRYVVRCDMRDGDGLPIVETHRAVAN